MRKVSEVLEELIMGIQPGRVKTAEYDKALFTALYYLVKCEESRQVDTINTGVEVCPVCGNEDLAKVKGCLRCFKCGWKGDCNGW